MSNKVAFSNVVSRAQTKADNQICLIENMPITTNVGIILYADKRIKELEAQLAEYKAEFDDVSGETVHEESAEEAYRRGQAEVGYTK
ncbi:hypothetical protein HOT32_gp06 [Erwinia phage Faunus]|uniref:Uncharacterized protein n=1 Tax=Erwinia phage Faunus TaxID=2182346 RepID=A0A2U8UWG1_9CAUD|nr:hypothetical protein HOT32_gp06 [Erwinia phage Faunus]AWN08589.1 hypothetical protein [Erwinia phage Faunus]